MNNKRVNSDIKSNRVMVIGIDGTQLGQMPTNIAISKAQNQGYDLVEVSDKSNSNKYYEYKNYGILVCGTGQGMNITANKFDKIRCALCHNEYTAIMSRQHNNANIISIGQRLFEEKDYKQVLNIVEKFINTEFEGGRHLRRINKI